MTAGLDYWGGMFPDAAGRTFTSPGTHAELELQEPLTFSGALGYLTWRARAVGVGGNSIRIKIEADGLGCFVVEDGNDVRATFVPGETTVAEFFSVVNAQSLLTELVGNYNPSDLLIDGEDEFEFIELEHGKEPVTSIVAFWGTHFPDGAGVVPPLVEPIGPQTAATFEIQLESGLEVTYTWVTDVFKSYNGKERRASILDDPKQHYSGSAFLLGNHVRQVRSQLARYASHGRPFLLGLPFEETTLTADAIDFTFPVPDTSVLDWANKGQRVIVIGGPEDDSIEGVIQDVTSTTIVLDRGPSTVGVSGARMLPAMAVLFEPQQGFRRHRHPDLIDYWDIKGRAALFGFPSAPVPGELTFESGGLSGVTFRARTPAIAVTLSLEITLLSGSEFIFGVVTGDGTLDIAIDAPDEATLGELRDAINANGLLWMLGDFDPATVFTSSDDFSEALTGAESGGPGEMGRGAELAMFGDRPIWDRGVSTESTAADGIHSLAELVDLGGVPAGVGAADIPDWARQMSIATSIVEGWQFTKAFLFAIRGRWKSFWLPTHRADLEATEDATPTTITIDTDIGDFELWFNRGYTLLRVEQESGVTFVNITAAVNNGDGTTTLTVEPDDGQDAPSAGPVEMLSWLELCRLESDEVTVGFRGANFAMQVLARVVHHGFDTGVGGWEDDEGSIEASEPREGIEIQHGATTYHIGTGSRDEVIAGNTFFAMQGDRGELGVSSSSNSRDLTIRLLVSHPFAQRYLAPSPPQSIRVYLWRKQERSGQYERTWRGTINGASVDGHIISFAAPSLLMQHLDRTIPNMTAGRQCPHILYDDNCQASRAGENVVVSSVGSFDANAVTLSTIEDKPDGWADGGELLHLPSGERITIQTQVGLVLTLHRPIFELADGDSLQVFRGCRHTPEACRDDFDNMDNYGGQPQMPRGEIFLKTGVGVYQSE